MIEIQDVTRTHRLGDTEVRALRGVTCSIERGSFNFIVGPSGSGKSSLLYLIGALDQPTSGDIRVDGQSLTAQSETQRDSYRQKDVGFIFQSFNLLGNLNALDNVLVPFLPRGISSELRGRAAALLRDVGLGARLHHQPRQLSGGEQQRVAIARALLKSPKLILADEPTGELDSQAGADVFRLLRELSSSTGATVIVVTHDSSFVSTHDNIIRMRDGRLETD